MLTPNASCTHSGFCGKAKPGECPMERMVYCEPESSDKSGSALYIFVHNMLVSRGIQHYNLATWNNFIKIHEASGGRRGDVAGIVGNAIASFSVMNQMARGMTGTAEDVLVEAVACTYKLLNGGRIVSHQEPWVLALKDSFVGFGGSEEVFLLACCGVRA